MNKFFSGAISIIFVTMTVSYLTLGTPFPFLADKSKSNYNQSISYAISAQNILEKLPKFTPVDEAGMSEVVALYKKSLESALRVNIDVLNEEFPGFGDHYRDEFIEGTSRLIPGLETGNFSDLMVGQTLIGDFKSWMEKNRPPVNGE